MRKQSLSLLLISVLGLAFTPNSASADNNNFMNPMKWFEKMFDNKNDHDDYYRRAYYRDRYYRDAYGPWSYGAGPWGNPWMQGQNWQANNQQQTQPAHIPE